MLPATRHVEHANAPVRPKVVLVAAQAVQLTLPVEPWNVFAGQRSQVARPLVAANEPAGHKLQVVEVP